MVITFSNGQNIQLDITEKDVNTIMASGGVVKIETLSKENVFIRANDVLCIRDDKSQRKGEIQKSIIEAIESAM